MKLQLVVRLYIGLWVKPPVKASRKRGKPVFVLPPPRPVIDTPGEASESWSKVEVA